MLWLVLFGCVFFVDVMFGVGLVFWCFWVIVFFVVCNVIVLLVVLVCILVFVVMLIECDCVYLLVLVFSLIGVGVLFVVL